MIQNEVINIETCEITENTLYEYYLEDEIYNLMSFPEYMNIFNINGCKIIEDVI